MEIGRKPHRKKGLGVGRGRKVERGVCRKKMW